MVGEEEWESCLERRGTYRETLETIVNDCDDNLSYETLDCIISLLNGGKMPLVEKFVHQSRKFSTLTCSKIPKDFRNSFYRFMGFDDVEIGELSFVFIKKNTTNSIMQYVLE